MNFVIFWIFFFILWYSLWITIWVIGTKKQKNWMIILGALCTLSFVGAIIAAIQINSMNKKALIAIELARLQLEKERWEAEKNKDY